MIPSSFYATTLLGIDARRDDVLSNPSIQNKGLRTKQAKE